MRPSCACGTLPPRRKGHLMDRADQRAFEPRAWTRADRVGYDLLTGPAAELTACIRIRSDAAAVGPAVDSVQKTETGPPVGVNLMNRFFLLSALICVFAVSVSAKNAVAGEAADVPTKVKLKDADWAAVKKFVAQQKDRVVVVDLWSTSCAPCMKEFPHLVKLQKAYGKKIVCVSFNLDYAGIKTKPPAYYRPRVEKFLKTQKATVHNYLATVDAFDVFEELDVFSIPVVLVYGKDGKLVRKFDESLLKDGKEEAFTYKDDINPLIEKLLK